MAYGVVLFALYSFFVQRYEEPHLAREFGDEYAAYVGNHRPLAPPPPPQGQLLNPP